MTERRIMGGRVYEFETGLGWARVLRELTPTQEERAAMEAGKRVTEALRAEAQ